MKKILVTENMSQAGIDFLREKGYEVHFPGGTSEGELVSAVAGCEGLIVRIAPITRRVIESATALRVIGKHGVGTDNIDIQSVKENNIRIVNTPMANTSSVAEYTIAMILVCARRIPFMSECYRKGDAHAKDHVVCYQLKGRTLGLIGAGRIGREVGRMASEGFGMRVIAYDPYLKDVPQNFSLVEDWDDLFRKADIISIHMPLLPKTRHCIGKHEFETMKEDAFIINCARGPIIDEDALIDALKSKEIGGAGLDVTEKEPADLNSPLFQMDNVILTAHNAATTKEAMDAMALDAAQGVDDFLSGKSPKYIVI